METLKSTLKGLRHDLGAKNAELAITKAEAEAFRRQLIPGAGGTLHADTEVRTAIRTKSALQRKCRHDCICDLTTCPAVGARLWD